MTRQKKELWKKISQMEQFIEAESRLGCGFGTNNDLHDEIYRMEAELANLSHYNSIEEMYFDNRGEHI